MVQILAKLNDRVVLILLLVSADLLPPVLAPVSEHDLAPLVDSRDVVCPPDIGNLHKYLIVVLFDNTQDSFILISGYIFYHVLCLENCRHHFSRAPGSVR